ncbi:MAG TPA: hypothetical protein VHM00_04655 [Caldimonas sp.]|jgi:hypothetical protein|nr:hypothetical protein [Caldimonas sp.]HEX2540355.1 hypothetical protein [Caldimonas sp.]
MSKPFTLDGGGSRARRGVVFALASCGAMVERSIADAALGIQRANIKTE